MRNIAITASLAVMVLLGGAEQASAQATAANKVGMVDLQRTLNETKIGRRAKAKLEKEQKNRQGQLDKEKTAFEKKVADLEKQRVLLKPEALAKRQQSLQQEYMALQQKFLQLQQELTQKENELTREIFKKAQSTIDAIAKRDGYSLIIERTGVLYFNPVVDITAELNRRLDGKK